MQQLIENAGRRANLLTPDKAITVPLGGPSDGLRLSFLFAQNPSLGDGSYGVRSTSQCCPFPLIQFDGISTGQSNLSGPISWLLL